VQQQAAATKAPPDVILESQLELEPQPFLESQLVIAQFPAVQHPLSPQPEQLPSAHVQFTHTQFVQQHDFWSRHKNCHT
jgi:hypothetical protein